MVVRVKLQLWLHICLETGFSVQHIAANRQLLGGQRFVLADRSEMFVYPWRTLRLHLRIWSHSDVIQVRLRIHHKVSQSVDLGFKTVDLLPWVALGHRVSAFCTPLQVITALD
jgi:hypothetical protein